MGGLSFKHRHNIVLKAVCGEANDVDMQTVADWTGKIEDLVAGYEPRNVYNGDETGLFFYSVAFEDTDCTWR